MNMETKTIENGAIEVKVDISKATDNEIKQLVFLVASNITVVIKRQDIHPKDLVKLSTLYGIVNYVPLWCVHKQYPEIIRVTNKIINDKGQAGLFCRGELDWHCNGMTAKEPEEVVLFYGKEIGQHSNQTIYSNGVANAGDSIKGADILSLENIDLKRLGSYHSALNNNSTLEIRKSEVLVKDIIKKEYILNFDKLRERYIDD